MNRIWIFLVFIIFSFGAQQNSSELKSLTVEFESEHPEASLGFYVYNSSSKTEFFSFNGEKNLIPASSLKTLTTASALEILGANFQFETKVGYSGSLNNGIVDGDLIIKAAGDPSLGSSYFKNHTLFETLIKTFQAEGIKKISGKIIIDQSNFEKQSTPATWIWEDMGNYYGAEAAPLSVFDNTINITFQSNQIAGGATSIIQIEPAIAGLTFMNEVVSSNSRSDNAYVFGAPNQLNRTIRGTIPKSAGTFTIKASMPNPGIYFANCLAKKSQAAGIEITSDQAQITFQEQKVNAWLHSFISPKLAEIVKQTNMESLNLYAELILKQIGLKSSGVGSVQTGIESIKSYWIDRGLDLSNTNLFDGSGLSRHNNISAKHLALLMHKMAQGKNKEAFFNSLPIAGLSGSISGMFYGTSAYKNLRAKSGYLTGVRSYTGYIKSNNGDDLTFCIMANNYSCSSGEMRRSIEKLLGNMAQ